MASRLIQQDTAPCVYYYKLYSTDTFNVVFSIQIRFQSGNVKWVNLLEFVLIVFYGHKQQQANSQYFHQAGAIIVARATAPE